MWRACGASAWRGGAGSTRSRFWLGLPGASSRADRILRDFSARYHGGPVDAGSLPGGERFQRTRGRSRAGARGAGYPYRPLPPARSRPRRRCRLARTPALGRAQQAAAAYTMAVRSGRAGQRPQPAAPSPPPRLRLATYGVSRATYIPAAPPRRAAGRRAALAPPPDRPDRPHPNGARRGGSGSNCSSGSSS